MGMDGGVECGVAGEVRRGRLGLVWIGLVRSRR